MLKDAAWPWNWGKNSPKNVLPQFKNPAPNPDIDITQTQPFLSSIRSNIDKLINITNQTIRPKINLLHQQVPSFYADKIDKNITKNPLSGLFYFISLLSLDHFEATVDSSIQLLDYMEQRKAEFENNSQLMQKFDFILLQTQLLCQGIEEAQLCINEIVNKEIEMRSNKNFHTPSFSTLPGIGDFYENLSKAISYLRINPLNEKMQRQTVESLNLMEKFLNGDYVYRMPSLHSVKPVPPSPKYEYVAPNATPIVNPVAQKTPDINRQEIMSQIKDLLKYIDQIPDIDDGQKAAFKNLLLNEIPNNSDNAEEIVTEEPKEKQQPASNQNAVSIPQNIATDMLNKIGTERFNVIEDRVKRIKEKLNQEGSIQEPKSAMKNKNVILLAKMAEKIEPISKELAELIDKYIEEEVEDNENESFPTIPTKATLIRG